MLICVLTVGLQPALCHTSFKQVMATRLQGFEQWVVLKINEVEAKRRTFPNAHVKCMHCCIPRAFETALVSAQISQCLVGKTIQWTVFIYIVYIICSVPYDNRDWRVCNESVLGMCSDSPRRNKLPGPHCWQMFSQSSKSDKYVCWKIFGFMIPRYGTDSSQNFFFLWFVVVSNCQMLSSGAHWIGCASLLFLPLDRFVKNK